MTETNKTPTSAMPVRGGVVAYLQVDGAMKAAEFYKRAFGAEVVAAHPEDEKRRTMHVHLYINGTSVMLATPIPSTAIRCDSRKPSISCFRSTTSTRGLSRPSMPARRW
jgi:uncharacterized glyoxalase superfamily protein PhnB